LILEVGPQDYADKRRHYQMKVIVLGDALQALNQFERFLMNASFFHVIWLHQMIFSLAGGLDIRVTFIL
jgi:hypothetical protein